MRRKFATVGLLAFIVSSFSAWAEVIDLSKAVREAGAGTTELKVTQNVTGKNLDGYTVDNAFGEGETKADRIMLVDRPYNPILWTIADDFEEGKSIVVTKFTIKRTSPASETGSPYDVNRAPTEFCFQASQDGTTWVTLKEVVTPAEEKATYWKDDLERKFETDDWCSRSRPMVLAVDESTMRSSAPLMRLALRKEVEDEDEQI